MAIDLAFLRSLAQKAEQESPFDISPTLPFVNISSTEGPISISFDVPKDEGAEFSHWRHLVDLEFVRATHEGRPGLGKSGNKVVGLTAKGQEFVELSRDDAIWTVVLARCERAKARTVGIVIEQLRKEARMRLAKLEGK